MNNESTDITKWLIRKCGTTWFIWKPFHGVPDYRADRFADIPAGRTTRLNWI